MLLNMTIDVLLPAAMEWWVNGIIHSPVLYTDPEQVETVMAFHGDKFGILTLQDSQLIAFSIPPGFRLECPGLCILN